MWSFFLVSWNVVVTVLAQSEVYWTVLGGDGGRWVTVSVSKVGAEQEETNTT